MFELTHLGVLVVVYSRSTELATVFAFALLSPLQLPQSISDPFILRLSNMQREEVSGVIEPQIQTQGRSPATLCMCPLKNPQSSTTGSDELGEDFPQFALPFYQLFVLYKDLGVSERLYILVEDGQNLQGNYLAQRTRFNTANNLRSIVRDSFIVPGVFISDVEETDSQNEDREYEAVHTSGGTRSSAGPRDSSVLDLKWLATMIEDGRSTTIRRASSAKVFAKVINNAMAGLDPQTPGIRVL